MPLYIRERLNSLLETSWKLRIPLFAEYRTHLGHDDVVVWRQRHLLDCNVVHLRAHLGFSRQGETAVMFSRGAAISVCLRVSLLRRKADGVDTSEPTCCVEHFLAKTSSALLVHRSCTSQNQKMNKHGGRAADLIGSAVTAVFLWE